MKSKFILSATLFALGILSITSEIKGQAFGDLESGLVFNGYNNVRIPGDTGTLLSLTSDLQSKPTGFVRLRAGYTIKSRHTIFLLYAPLTVKSTGSMASQISFDDQIFQANTLINASYTFNSYRITYRYDIVKKPNLEFGFGFTAKIRDAEIALHSQGVDASKKNVGFVPIINFRLHWKATEKIGVLFEGDALAAPQGRAEDVLLAGTVNFSEQFQFRLGYRILEGGTDNDEVYNFSLFHYASVGLSYTFKNRKAQIKKQ